MHPLIFLALVDDDPAVRDLWTRQLSRAAGFEITGVFADAESALPALLAAPPALLLVDLKLPGMDGLALTARVKAVHPDVRAVLITNHDLDELPLAAVRAEVDGCLLKPDSPITLPDQLRAVLAGTCIYSRRVTQRLVAQVSELSLPVVNPALALLTPRERELLARLRGGCSLKEAAGYMGVAYSTVNTLRERAHRKLGAHKLAAARGAVVILLADRQNLQRTVNFRTKSWKLNPPATEPFIPPCWLYLLGQRRQVRPEERCREPRGAGMSTSQGSALRRRYSE